jgi:hypothetical protein
MEMARMTQLLLAACTGASLRAGAPPSMAQAAFVDGRWLYESCTQPPSSVGLCQCAGFIAGVSDTADLARDLGGSPGWRSCPAETVGLGQMVEAVTRYLRNHSDQSHFTAAGLVALALGEAFPCRQ